LEGSNEGYEDRAITRDDIENNEIVDAGFTQQFAKIQWDVSIYSIFSFQDSKYSRCIFNAVFIKSVMILYLFRTTKSWRFCLVIWKE
jgi:hypothetical protein